MKLSKEQLSRIYRQKTARSAQERDSCITAEALVRASAGEMTPSERERVADHLSACADCAQEYQMIRSLRSLSPEVAGTGPGTQPPLIRELPRAVPGKHHSIQWWQPAPILWPIAASLLIAAVGLGVWMIPLRQENRRLAAALEARDRAIAEARRQLDQYATQTAELRRDVDLFSQPQLNAPIIDLDPNDSARGSSTQPPRTVFIPATANVFTLVLNMGASQPSFSDYALEIVGPNGEAIWTGQGLQKSALDTFRVAIPRKLVPAGRYGIKLYGLRGDRRNLIEDYRMRIQYR